MAKQKNNYGVEFVVINLNDAQKQDFVVWAEKNLKSIFKHVAELTQDGYKLSFSSDFENDCFIVSMTGSDTAPYNVKNCFSSRSQNLEEATLLAIYKHIVIAQEKSWTEVSTKRDMTWG